MGSRWNQFIVSLVVCFAAVSSYYVWTTFKTKNLEEPIRFTIPSTQGVFDLEDYRGQTVFVFFGFTRCPHICPTTLQQLSGMMKKLKPEEAQKTKVLFISIDPEVDTLEVLKKHMNFFGDSFIGATDKDENLKKITNIFGANYTRTGVIDHTSTVFVINDKGYLVDILPYTASSEDLYNAHLQSFDRGSILEAIKTKDEIEVLADNRDCDLSKSVCEITINNQDTFTLKLNPQPLKTESAVNVELLANSLNYEPQSIDISGVELNMGYIRPEFDKTGPSIFKTSFFLPVCELKEMSWEVTVRFKSKDQAPVTPVVKYHFKTLQKNETL